MILYNSARVHVVHNSNKKQKQKSLMYNLDTLVNVY